MPLPGPVRALRYRNFRLFFVGQLVSLIGTWMQSVAQSWLVYRLTGSSVLLGAVGFCSQFPVLLFAPLGGTVADRGNRHRTVVATQTASMLLSFLFAGLTLTDTIKIWHVFVLAALLGVVNAFDIASRQALIGTMTAKEDLMNAIALNSTILNASRIVGPAIAGLLVAKFGEGWCIFANGLSFIAVLIGLLRMEVPPQAQVEAKGSALDTIREGFAFVLSNEPLYLTLGLVGVSNLLGYSVSVLMPIFADQILKGGPETLGTLVSAIGLGALGAAVSLALRSSLRGLSKLVASAAVILGSFAILFSMSRSYSLSLALLVPVGFGNMLILGGSNTLLQSMVPDAMRGRIMSKHSMMVSGMASFGSLLAGAEAARFGAPLTVAINCAIVAAAGIGYFLRIPKFRNQARELVERSR